MTIFDSKTSAVCGNRWSVNRLNFFAGPNAASNYKSWIIGTAPYEYPGDCENGCVSTAVTSGEKIFIELEILSPDELTEWMARSSACTCNEQVADK